MIEVGQHTVDQLAPTWIRRGCALGEEAQQITGLLDRLRPVRSGSGREQILKLGLTRVQRGLISLDFGLQPSKLGCLLGRHPAVRVEASRLIKHGPIPPYPPRGRHLVPKLARPAVGPAFWPIAGSVQRTKE